MIFKNLGTTKGISQIKEFAHANNLCYKTAQILMQRGIDTTEKYNEFINPNVKNLENPFNLINMSFVVEKIKKAVNTKQKILIYGDYDADGISATAILYKYLTTLNASVKYFLLNRYVDGYGLNLDNIKTILGTEKPDLLITVDCGISCYDEVEFLKQNGVDVIVTDHHEMPEKLPDCLIIDPKMPNQKFSFDGLCGAGVALKIAQAMGANDQLIEEYLAIASIATIADIVPLVKENRNIVINGLKNQHKLPYGIKLLVRELKIKKIQSGDVSFKLAPKINAAGRMGNAEVALKLYISNNKKELDDCLKKLSEQNTNRQVMCNSIYEECVEEINKNNFYNKKSIVLYNGSWDNGLLGIACARLMDDYTKLIILFSDENDLLRGSVRSVNGINVHDVLTNNKYVVETFGHHSMAGELTIKKSDLDNFKTEVEKYLDETTTVEKYVASKTYDTEILIDDITPKLANEIDSLEPFGLENTRPLFLINYENCSTSRMKNLPKHLNIVINKNLKMVNFNASSLLKNYEFCSVKKSLIDIQKPDCKNKQFLKGLIRQTLFNGYNKSVENYASGNYLLQFETEENGQSALISSYKNNELLDLLHDKLKSPLGTVIVVNSFNSYVNNKAILSKFKINYFVGDISFKNNENAVIMAPENHEVLKRFNNIIFLDTLLSKDYVQNLSGTIFIPAENKYHLPKLNLEKSYFSLVLKAISLMVKGNEVYFGKYEMYEKFKHNNQFARISYAQFMACLITLNELKLITILDEEDGIKVVVNSPLKYNLTDSKFYNNLRLLSNLH